MFPCLLSICLLWSRLCLQGWVVQYFINELMKCLACPSRPCGLVSLLFSVLPTPRLGAPAGLIPIPAVGDGPCARAAEAPGGLSSRPGRTRPGSRPDPGLAPGGETGRRAPPFLAGVRGTAAARTRRQQQTPNRVRSDSVGAAGPGCQPEEGGSGAVPWTQERGPPTTALWTQAWGFPGPGSRPPGKIPAFFRAPRPLPGRAGGGGSRNLPRDRRRVTGQNPPIYGQRFRCVSGESPGVRCWAGPRLRTAHIALGILPPGVGRLDSVPALDFPTPESGDSWRVWTPGLGSRYA